MLDYQRVAIKPTTGYILWVISHGLHVTNLTTKYWEYLGKVWMGYLPELLDDISMFHRTKPRILGQPANWMGSQRLG